MRSVLEALELVPVAAALHECPSLTVVARNELATTDPPDDDVGTAARDACDGVDEIVTVETKRGWYCVSPLRGGPDLARPDLVLLTYAGSGKSHSFAMLQHRRALAVLAVNEHAERTSRMLEDALVQLRAALEAQRVLVDQATALMVDTPVNGGP